MTIIITVLQLGKHSHLNEKSNDQGVFKENHWNFLMRKLLKLLILLFISKYVMAERDLYCIFFIVQLGFAWHWCEWVTIMQEMAMLTAR